jgi:hypothetical protein
VRKPITCPAYDSSYLIQKIPREAGRRQEHEQIIVAGMTSPQNRTIAIMRVKYELDYLCSAYSRQWITTFETEKQKCV